MIFLVTDYEATCCDHNEFPQKEEAEIIEWGTVAATADGTVLSEFNHFIKPIKHPILTEFCTELTSIQKSDVEHAQSFPEVVQLFDEWISQFDDKLTFCSVGQYDLNQLRKQLNEYEIHLENIDLLREKAPFINIKKAFCKGQGLTSRKATRISLKGMLRKVDIDLSGTYHRGIDDARNAAKLLPYCKLWS